MTGSEAIEKIRQKTDTVLLSFSCGKDAICAWLALRPHFRVVPFYCYLVPDLEFVENSIRYYEQFFLSRIIRVPHPSLYRMLNNMVFQPPDNCRLIEACEFSAIDYEDIAELLREDLSLGENVYVASGVRAADSPFRRAACTKYGCINEKRRHFWPVWDWKKADVRKALIESGVKLPLDYKLFGRSFDGLDYRFLKPIHDHLPCDYRRILDLFPLAELEIKRRQYVAS